MTIKRQFDRREFIVTSLAGSLAIGCRVPPGEDFSAAIGKNPWEALASASDAELNPWLVITPDDEVIIRVAQSEMGQCTFTSWAKMIVEELQCDWSRVRTEYASVNRHLRENEVYQRMGTFSSSSVRLSRKYLQQAGASARERLMAAAAQEWGVDRSQLKAENGKVIHTPSGRRLRFGQLVEKASTIQLESEPEIKTPDQFTFMNKPTKLLETPLRVNGAATYGLDIRLPEMLYAAVKASPVFYGKVKSYDFETIKDRPGLHSAVSFGEHRVGNAPLTGLDHHIEHGVAVIADNYWRAKTALDALPIEWEPGEHATASSKEFFRVAREALEEAGTVVVNKGDAMGAMKNVSQVVEAVYELPFLDHAVMEPLNCTVRITQDQVDVWAGTQDPHNALLEVAKLTGLPKERVFLHSCFLGGGFGRRIYNDEIRQAVAIAKQINRPIKVIWSREETTRHGAYRPMRVAKFQAGLGPDGLPVAYFNRNIGFSKPTDRDYEQIFRGLHEVPYAIPNQRVDYHQKPNHVPRGAWTSVGRSQNVFLMESFIDEMAHAAGRDPYQYRRRLLEANSSFTQHKRWVQALDVAAEKSGWGKTLPSGTGLGIAIDDSRRPTRPQIGICALVARVSVSRAGELTVERIDVAFDTGPFLVNPPTVERQIEMQVASALGAALHQEITIEQGRVVQSNFHDYPLLSMREMPEVAIHFLKTSDEEIVGVGEEALGMVAPAVCNAIFAATGERFRSLPLRKHDLSWS